MKKILIMITFLLSIFLFDNSLVKADNDIYYSNYAINLSNEILPDGYGEIISYMTLPIDVKSTLKLYYDDFSEDDVAVLSYSEDVLINGKHEYRSKYALLKWSSLPEWYIDEEYIGIKDGKFVKVEIINKQEVITINSVLYADPICNMDMYLGSYFDCSIVQYYAFLNFDVPLDKLLSVTCSFNLHYKEKNLLDKIIDSDLLGLYYELTPSTFKCEQSSDKSVVYNAMFFRDVDDTKIDFKFQNPIFTNIFSTLNSIVNLNEYFSKLEELDNLRDYISCGIDGLYIIEPSDSDYFGNLDLNGTKSSEYQYMIALGSTVNMLGKYVYLGENEASTDFTVLNLLYEYEDVIYYSDNVIVNNTNIDNFDKPSFLPSGITDIIQNIANKITGDPNSIESEKLASNIENYILYFIYFVILIFIISLIILFVIYYRNSKPGNFTLDVNMKDSQKKTDYYYKKKK